MTVTLRTPTGTMNEYRPGEVNAMLFVAAASATSVLTQPSATNATAKQSVRDAEMMFIARSTTACTRVLIAGGAVDGA
jgi:hypothetical protein